MLAEPQTISRILEFFHLPMQHHQEALRSVYLHVSQSCGYDNFSRLPDGARLATAEGEGVGSSSITFHKDRMIFREDFVPATLDEFLKRVEESLDKSVRELNIPVLIARNLTFRALIGLPSGQLAPKFLSDHLFRVDDQHLAACGQPGQLVGFRLQFAPKDPRLEAHHQVRIESYGRDPQSLFVEDIGTFKIPVQGQDWKRLAWEAREVEKFLLEKISHFLSQFGE